MTRDSNPIKFVFLRRKYHIAYLITFTYSASDVRCLFPYSWNSTGTNVLITYARHLRRPSVYFIEYNRGTSPHKHVYVHYGVVMMLKSNSPCKLIVQIRNTITFNRTSTNLHILKNVVTFFCDLPILKSLISVINFSLVIFIGISIWGMTSRTISVAT